MQQILRVSLRTSQGWRSGGWLFRPPVAGDAIGGEPGGSGSCPGSRSSGARARPPAELPALRSILDDPLNGILNDLLVLGDHDPPATPLTRRTCPRLDKHGDIGIRRSHGFEPLHRTAPGAHLSLKSVILHAYRTCREESTAVRAAGREAWLPEECRGGQFSCYGNLHRRRNSLFYSVQ